MQKIKDRLFDVIIIFGLVFLIMQISVITSENTSVIKNTPQQTAETVQPEKETAANNNSVLLPDQTKNEVPAEDKAKDVSIDL